MSNFTIEELKRILAWEEPKLEDFHDNGGYDERSFEYQKGLYANRQEYGKELLEALQTIEQLTADLVIEAEQHQNAAETCLSLKQELDASSVLLTQATAENRTLQAKIDAALAIEPPSLSQSVNAPFARGQSAMRAEFRKALEGKG